MKRMARLPKRRVFLALVLILACGLLLSGCASLDVEAEPVEMGESLTVTDVQPKPFAGYRPKVTPARMPARIPVQRVTLRFGGQSQAVAAQGSPQSLPQTLAHIRYSPACCRLCQPGQSCGNGCISAEKSCRQPLGCACS